MSYNSAIGRSLITAKPKGFISTTKPVNIASGCTQGIQTTFSVRGDLYAQPNTVAYAAVAMNGSGSSMAFSDTTGTTWTPVATTGGTQSHIRLSLFKAIVPAGGFSRSTVFTLTTQFTKNGVAVVVTNFPMCTSVPGTNDAISGETTAAGWNITVAGPTLPTSFQFAIVGANHNPNPYLANPTGASTGGWALNSALHLSESQVFPDVCLATYWRQASSTASTSLVITGATDFTAYAYSEAAI